MVSTYQCGCSPLKCFNNCFIISRIIDKSMARYMLAFLPNIVLEKAICLISGWLAGISHHIIHLLDEIACHLLRYHPIISFHRGFREVTIGNLVVLNTSYVSHILIVNFNKTATTAKAMASH